MLSLYSFPSIVVVSLSMIVAISPFGIIDSIFGTMLVFPVSFFFSGSCIFPIFIFVSL